MIKSILAAGLCAAALAAATATPAAAQEPDAEAVVNAMNAVSGKFPKTRASGAKGFCAKGTFTPTAEAPGLSKAPLLAKEGPVTARFSMGGGNPKISDKAKPVTRGFSLRFGEGEMDLVLISAPVFGAKTPKQLFDALTAAAPGPDGKVDAEKLAAFRAANPEVLRQAAWLNARQVPATVAGVDYWGVHAYTLTNAEGEATTVKFKALPAAGQIGLSEEELKVTPDTFYADEFKERLGRGPAGFDLVAILGEAGDPVDDITAAWPEENRRSAKLGTVAITALEPNATCDAFTFDPINLPEGIAGPANDQMFEIRSSTYAISLTRRAE